MNNFNTINWRERINILADIVSGLQYIHKQGWLHCNLHSGNVLVNHSYGKPKNSLPFTKPNVWITDIGNYYPNDPDKGDGDNNNKNTKEGYSVDERDRIKGGGTIYGLLPYLAPEILCGQSRTKASDIYSLGIIMWEIASYLVPYSEYVYDEELALKICRGLRPKIIKGTPDCYIKLMERCWNAIPAERPKTEEIMIILSLWNNNNNNNEFAKAEKAHQKLSIKAKNNENEGRGTASDAIIRPKKLSSCFHYFESLPRPRNSKAYEEKIQITTYEEKTQITTYNERAYLNLSLY